MGSKLLKVTHIKIGWDWCYRCFGLGHMAVDCPEPDQSRGCLRCGKERHTAAFFKETALLSSRRKRR